MAKIKPKQAHAEEIIDHFSGIGSKKTFGEGGAVDMRNFRILQDGSLQKRCGWYSPFTFNAPVRGCWNGTVGGRSFIFFVAGDEICRVQEDGTEHYIGNLEYGIGRVRFFVYRDRLYLMDGNRLLVYRESADDFVSPAGYAPLYGRNWHPTDLGPVNEDINLLSERIRVHYYNSTGGNSFMLPFFAKKIDQVRVDTKLTSNYTLEDDGATLRLGFVGQSVEIAFTASFLSETYDLLMNTTLAFSEINADGEQLFLYGAQKGNYLFCSSSVSSIMYYGSLAAYSDTDCLYFTSARLLTLGDAMHPIRAVCRNHHRYLAFHSDGAYSISLASDSNLAEVYPLLNGIGCVSADALLYLEGDPVVAHATGILHLHSTAGDPDQFEITCLSVPIRHKILDHIGYQMIAVENPKYGELWFCNPFADESLIWVYQIHRKEWYCFDGILPTFFFFLGNQLGFASDQMLCLFDEGENSDGGLEIRALYRTGYLDFGYPEEIKRSLRVTLCTDNGSNPTVLDIETEDLHETVPCYQSPASQFFTVFDKRTEVGRFRVCRVTLTDTGERRPHYYRLALFANL